MAETIPARLAAIVRGRRAARRLTQAQAAQLADVSLATWNLLESGRQERFRPFTLRKVSTALMLPDDALERVAAGEDPETVVSPMAFIHLDRPATSAESAGGATRDIVTRGSITPSGEMTARVIRGRNSNMAFIDHNLDKLDDAGLAQLAGYLQRMIDEGI